MFAQGFYSGGHIFVLVGAKKSCDPKTGQWHYSFWANNSVTYEKHAQCELATDTVHGVALTGDNLYKELGGYRRVAMLVDP